MKLSEKLAAIEAAEPKRAADPPRTAATIPLIPKARAGAGRTTRPGAKAGAARLRGSPANWEETKRKVRSLVLASVAPKMARLGSEQLVVEVKAAIDAILKREDVHVSPLERHKFVQEMVADTLGYGPLDPLLQDPTVTEIMCNSHDEIWVERQGRIAPTDTVFTDDAQYRQVIDKIVSAVGRRLDEGAPMVDARLPDGSRVNAIIPPLAIHGAVLTIRKFSVSPYQVEDLVNFGTYTPELVAVMQGCVRGRLNILISGGTGTGKTTNLNVLSSFIPPGERIVTIEDSAELQLQQPHVVSLEARPPNAEGAGEIRIRDLVRNSLRMRPDRIIVGEVRGPESLDMLQAMNTGHEGSMTTIHANSPRDALSRLETMVLMAGYDLPVRAIREQMASALNLIMHVDRTREGRRVVTAVTEVQGMEGDVILLQDLFTHRLRHDRDGTQAGELVATGLRPKFLERLAAEGVALPPGVFQAPGRGR